MDASFFSKPLSQLECRDNKKSCHLLEEKRTHPMRMHDNNTTCNRSNQNAGFLDTTNTTCNRSNQNARLPDTHSRSTNQHPATPDTTKTMCYQSVAQCWKAFLVFLWNMNFTSFAINRNILYSKRNWDKGLMIGLKIIFLSRYQLPTNLGGYVSNTFSCIVFCYKRLLTREYSLVKLHTLLIYILWQIIMSRGICCFVNIPPG